jgi:aspartate aminotransferase
VSFDSPDSVKKAMVQAIADNRTHYLQTAGVPRLRELIAAKLRDKNRIPVEDAEDVLVTHGGIHGLYLICRALLEPGDEVIIPDPEWPPAAGNILAARGVPVGCPLHEAAGWRYDLDELASKITNRTRVIYLNSPQNPTGGVLTRADLEQIAAIARERNVWVISDEAYEDVVFDGEHVSIASLPGMYERTIPLYTFSKSYAMTGLRLGYVAIRDTVIRDRAKKLLFYTASNVASVVQFGGIGALEGPQDCIETFRQELRARRDLFYRGIHELPATRSAASRPRARSMLSCESTGRAKNQRIRIVGDGRAPDQARPRWLRAGRRLWSGRRRVHPFLLRTRPERVDRGAGVDETVSGRIVDSRNRAVGTVVVGSRRSSSGSIRTTD